MFPLGSVLDIPLIQAHLHTFERIVELLVVKFVIVLIPHAEDGSDECLFMLIQEDSILNQHTEED